MLLRALVFVLCASRVFSQTSPDESSLIVQTTSGALRGDRSEANGTDRWLGIRYAQPPVGSLRFKAPIAYTNDSTDIVNAFEFGNACPQVPSDTLGAPTGEDCLHLNVILHVPSVMHSYMNYFPGMASN